MNIIHKDSISAECRREAEKTVDKGIMYERIKILLAECGPLTVKEVAVRMYERGWIEEPNRQIPAPRLTELEYENQVKVEKKKVCQYTGRKVGLYELV